jgi:hypothetical protein
MNDEATLLRQGPAKNDQLVRRYEPRLREMVGACLNAFAPDVDIDDSLVEAVRS